MVIREIALCIGRDSSSLKKIWLWGKIPLFSPSLLKKRIILFSSHFPHHKFNVINTEEQ